jgi:ferric-dicitrate binding protein FerR (iron transport regulator)
MNGHDSIEVLLKATGRRPAVPADRTERVRAAAYDTWRREVARHARWRRIAWGVSLAAAAVVVVAVGLGFWATRPSMPLPTSGIRVERVANTTLTVGAIVPWGDEVTTGADARVALRVPSGHSLRLDTDTTLRVRSDREFSLERGALYVDSRGEPAGPVTSLRIDTALGSIEDHGTQFAVRFAGDSLSLQVREGTVTLSAHSERAVATAGQALRLDASGRIVRTEDAGRGAGWAWAEAIAPMMEIEGRSLLDFLEWVVRERGVRLQFTDAALARRAPEIVLKGSIAGMTLEQATASVLATCGAIHRWDDGALVVGAEPAP